MTENDFTDATSMVPNRRHGRRKIFINTVPARNSEVEKESAAPTLKEQPYETFKELICVVCARELEVEKLDDYRNIYTDTSNSGSSLYDVFRALIKQDIQYTFYGSKVSHGYTLFSREIDPEKATTFLFQICNKSFGHINNIES